MAWESLLVQRGVPRTLAHRPDTRAPGVFRAPRVRSASFPATKWAEGGQFNGPPSPRRRRRRAPSLTGALPLGILLYAFWSRRSRLASARGGAHMAQ